MDSSSFFFAKDTRCFMKGKEVVEMTYKQIEASREARLWIGQVIIPAITVVGAAMTVPEVRKAVTEKANNVKTAIKKKFKKREA